MSKQNVVSDVSTLYERSILIRSYEHIHEGFKPSNQNFGNYFLSDIAKANRSKLSYLLWEIDFRNECKVGLVKRFEYRTWVEESMHLVENILPDNAPKFLVKEVGIPSGSGALWGPSWYTALSISTSVTGLSSCCFLFWSSFGIARTSISSIKVWTFLESVSWYWFSKCPTG